MKKTRIEKRYKDGEWDYGYYKESIPVGPGTNSEYQDIPCPKCNYHIPILTSPKIPLVREWKSMKSFLGESADNKFSCILSPLNITEAGIGIRLHGMDGFLEIENAQIEFDD